MPDLIKTIFLNMMAVSLIVGVLIGVIVAAAIWLSKRYSPRWRYWVWLVFALWLVVPVTLPAHWALLSFSVTDTPVFRSVGIVPLSEAAEPGVYEARDNEPEGYEPDGAQAQDPVPNGAVSEAETLVKETPVAGKLAGVWSGVTVLDIMIGLWFAGVVIFLCVRLIAALRFRALLRRFWRPCDSKELVRLVRRTMEEMDFHVEMDIRFSPGVQSPFVTGLFRPVLVLPERRYDPCLLTHIIRHELTHCRRRDLWYKLALNLANALHWFNPLVWMMNRAGDRDLELICDELVVRGQDGARRREYGESILLTVKPGRKRLPALTTAFSTGAGDLRERFESLTAKTGKRSGAFLAVLILLPAVVIGGGIRLDLAATAGEAYLAESGSGQEDYDGSGGDVVQGAGGDELSESPAQGSGEDAGGLTRPYTLGYWNSGNGGYASDPQITRTASNSANFLASKRFTRNELPVGSIIEVDAGYAYRPEGWVASGTAAPGRPKPVTTQRVVIDEAWWGNFEYRAFNILKSGLNVNLTGKEEETASHFRIYVPVYQGVNWRHTDLGYWNSNNGGYAANPQITTTADNSVYFLASQRFSRAELPVGSIIEVDAGYAYRPDGWVAAGTGAPGRPGLVTTQRVVIDKAWWGNYEYRAFNILKNGYNVNLTGQEGETASHFRIYIPTYSPLDWRYTGD
ncbi:MAG: hypothetical protein FWF88_08215 [Peptococcaceae bacterium]|nr:hypothetical protein [Peptococcaceae bacterium]